MNPDEVSPENKVPPINPDVIPPKHELSADEPTRLYDRLIWCALRACRIKCSLDEVRVRALKPNLEKRKWHLLPKDVKATSGAALAVAKDLYDAEDARIKHVDDKAKALLGATSILFTLSGAIIALTATREDATFRWLLGVALFLLLVTLFLLVGGYFGRSRFAQPVLNLETAIELENGNQNELVRDYQKSAWLDRLALEFLVAAYRAARRAFQAAMFVLAVAGLAALMTNYPNDAISRQLRNDPQFVEKVRGSKGEAGLIGPPGPTGPRGEVGPPGPGPSINVPSPTPTQPQALKKTRRKRPL